MNERSGRTSLVDYAAAATPGSRRSVNEDAFGIFEGDNVFVVADGCGGRSSGRDAADRTVACFGALRRSADLGIAGADPLALAVLHANADVYQAAKIDPNLMGQGATVCAVRMSPGWVSIVHAGDCRVGRSRDGRFEWLTEDHSPLAEARRIGSTPEELAGAEQHSTVVMRAVGTRETLAVDLTYQPAMFGDIYLLCTDGLTRHVPQTHILDLLSIGTTSLRERCSALLEASETAGGHDNATVIVLQLRS